MFWGKKCLILYCVLPFFPLSYFSGIELKLKGLLGSAEKWESIDDMKKIFWYKTTTMSGRFSSFANLEHNSTQQCHCHSFTTTGDCIQALCRYTIISSLQQQFFEVHWQVIKLIRSNQKSTIILFLEHKIQHFLFELT